jgi:ATP-dependent DNA helicase RecQ
MFRAGRSIDEIALERDIQPSTVGNHLARFISTGGIQLSELVPLHKVETIRNAVLKFNDGGALSPIKEFLGEDYTYGEIRAVIASI